MTTTTPTPGATTTFADLGLSPELVEALDEQGITSPFPIQELTLGLALQGADIIGQARTGTGKTLGFGLPMLQHLDKTTDTGVQVLVIVPTRELCVQVADDLEKAGSKKGEKGVGVLAVYGGKSLDPQIDALRGGDVEVVVGTPGRLLDLSRRGDLDLSSVRGLVLDEADEMLDLGFLPDVEQLIEQTSTPRQTLLFSATMPSAVVALARRYMDKPTFLRADVEEVHIGPQTEQYFFSCHRMDKPAVLARILQDPTRGLCVVFSRTKRMCDILAEELRDRGVNAAPIHSDLRQEAREKALGRFREGKIDVLVATEVAARGLDIDDVTHVVNYDCPDDEKMYLHRIGRTGRAGAAGVAITLAVWNELARLNMIKKALDIEVETHEVFSTSPILDELFDLPAREERKKPSKSREDEETTDARGKKGRGGRSTDAKGKDTKGKDTKGKDTKGKDTKGKDTKGKDTTPTRSRRSQEREEPSTEAATARAGEAEGDAEDPATRTRIRRRSRSAGDDAATAKPAADDTDDDTTDASGSRVRRRSRTRAADADDSSATSTPAANPPGSAGSDRAPSSAGDAGRTRTRTRSTPERPSGDRLRAGGEAPDVDSDEAPRERTRTRTRRSEAGSEQRARARSGEGRPSAEEGAGTSRGTSGKSGGRIDGGAGRAGGNGGGSPSRGGREKSAGGRGNGRSREPSRSNGRGKSKDADRTTARAEPVTSEEARGAGQPRLRRPLEVTHLP
jgi:superfamily II DNA/RNA helicase